MANPADFLQAPIPGQSLTDTPRNYPWERPPQMVDFEEVTLHYIKRLANKDTMDDLAVLFDGGMPIGPFVEAMTTLGVSEGLHNIDVKLIVSPVIHEFIKQAMQEYGIDAKDDTYNPKKDKNEREKRRLQTAVQLALAEAKREDRTPETDTGVALLQEVQDNLEKTPNEEVSETALEEADPQMDTAPQEEPRRGLMARETM